MSITATRWAGRLRESLGELRGVDPGDSVKIELRRGENTQTVTARIGTLATE